MRIFRLLAPVVVGAVTIGAAITASPAAADPAAPLTASPTAQGADLTWPQSTSPTAYYQLSVSDLTAGTAFSVFTNNADTQAHLSDLAAGDTYSVTVSSQPSGTVTATGTVVPTATPTSTLPAPTVTSVVPEVRADGAPGLAVQVATPSGAREINASAFTPSWALAARTSVPVSPGGATVLHLGPLQPATTYQLGVAGVDGIGQGGIAWLKSSTPSSPCTTNVCVDVQAPAAVHAFTANGLLNTVPNVTSPVASLHPAVIRVNTGYGSVAGAAQAVQTTGAALIENLADAWYNKTYSGLTGGVKPPWECWTCYSTFITNQVKAIEADGTSPAYWELMNEPGNGTYPAHLQGDAALYLQQLQIGAAAVRSVDPAARILAPTNGTFLVGGTSVQQPLLTLDAVLANAGTIPGLAGLDWHEISGGVTPTIAAADVDTARALAATAGLPALAMVVSEYTTPQDAPLAGAAASWLSALTAGNVSDASRACWTGEPVGTTDSTCAGQLADGLVTAAGVLTGPGLVSRDYADVAAGRYAPVSSTEADTRAVASYGSGWARVLLGSTVACLPSVSPGCQASAPTAGPTKTVTVSVPMSVRPKSARVTVVRAGVLAGTSTTTSASFSYSAGVARVAVSLPYAAAATLVLS